MTSVVRAGWTVSVFFTVAAAVTGFLFWRSPQAETATGQKRENPIAEVRVGLAKRITIRSVRELPATVEPTRVARLASPAEGPVARLLVREGDPVKSGQLLVVIGRNRTTRARLLSDREELRRLEDELDRVERLVIKGAVPGELLDKTKADVESAKAQVEAGEESSSDFQIRAPWAGVVSQVLVQDGNYVAPRAVLLEVFDPKSLVVRIAVPEAIALKVRPGSEARVRFDALPGSDMASEVTRLFPELDRKLRMRIAEIGVGDQKVLAPGMFARVHLTVEAVPEAVVVPATAVVTTPKQQRAVFVLDGDLARLRTVQPGIEEGALIQVVSGVSAGEVVVTSGHQKLKDGVRVRIKAEPPKPEKRPETAPSQAPSSESTGP